MLWIVLKVMLDSFIVLCYETANHPCCLEQSAKSKNISLSMVLDPFDIYGHDVTDKLDFLSHYQSSMEIVNNASDQTFINQAVHVATDHLRKFTQLHVKELKTLLISLDDTIDNMLTMNSIHNAISAERIATAVGGNSGPVPTDFYASEEFYCGKNVYIFISDCQSDITEMGNGVTPYCEGDRFHFFNFIHYMDDDKYYVAGNRELHFPLNNYMHGLECSNYVCIYRFPFKRNLMNARDVSTLPKAHIKCGTVVYKLPPVDDVSCTVTSGSFILDFNIKGVSFRIRDYVLLTSNGQHFYTKTVGDKNPIVCQNHVCEWNYTNIYGGPFPVPGQDIDFPLLKRPTTTTTTTVAPVEDIGNITYYVEGCWWLYPPNYGSIAGISYLDPLYMNQYRYTCSPGAHQIKKNLYWYPTWMNHPESTRYNSPGDEKTKLNYYPPSIKDNNFPGGNSLVDYY